MIAAPLFVAVVGLAFALQGLTVWLFLREYRPLVRAVVAQNGKELAVLDQVAAPRHRFAPARPRTPDEHEGTFTETRPRPLGL